MHASRGKIEDVTVSVAAYYQAHGLWQSLAREAVDDILCRTITTRRPTKV